MEELTPYETLVEGKWLFVGGAAKADANCERIEWLIKEKLVAVEGVELDWEILYQDPRDNRHWLLTYPQSQMHGGGPPMLRLVPEIEAEGLVESAS